MGGARHHAPQVFLFLIEIFPEDYFKNTNAHFYYQQQSNFHKSIQLINIYNVEFLHLKAIYRLFLSFGYEIIFHLCCPFNCFGHFTLTDMVVAICVQFCPTSGECIHLSNVECAYVHQNTTLLIHVTTPSKLGLAYFVSDYDTINLGCCSEF